MDNHILSVSQLNNLVKSLLEREPFLQNVCVRGEISNYKLYPSGHHYFTLKDSEAAVRCVLFKGSSNALRFRPQNGMAVLAVGRVSVYPKEGAYQLYCTRLFPDGAGDLNYAFEQLKQALFREGLFDPAHKKPLPAYPHRIGIVTSPAGAAVHDMLRILDKRYPLSKVVLLPVHVQGNEAPGEICRAIHYANAAGLADVLIVGRGGGSLEDLWAFNDERVARAIYQSEIPVVSAVGHEPDVTISDFTADLRAATPSNAAELVAPDQTELRGVLLGLKKAMISAVQRRITVSRQRLSGLSASPMLQNPTNYLQERRMRLDLIEGNLRQAGFRIIHDRKQKYLRLSTALDAMSPLKVISRGYSLTEDGEGNLVRSVHQLRPGQHITVRISDGNIQAAVLSAEEELS